MTIDNTGAIVTLPNGFDINKPMNYRDVPGFFCDRNKSFYEDMIFMAKDGDHFVEIGVWLGRSTAVMAHEIKKSGKKIRFDAIDHFSSTNQDAINTGKQIGLDTNNKNLIEGSPDTIEFMYNQFIKYMKACELLDYINPIIMKSAEASKLYRDNTLDFVYIDAKHEYEDVSNDTTVWYPKVKLGGIIAGHDAYFDGVRQAINELIMDYTICGTSWIHLKK